jgi:hypothetical protein
VGELATILVPFGVRMAAVRWHLTTPTPADLARWFRRKPKQPAP